MTEVERPLECGVELLDKPREPLVVAGLLDDDPNRTELVAEQLHPVAEGAEPVRVRHLDREAEAVRRLLGPAPEHVLVRQPVAGGVQLDGVELLRIQAQKVALPGPGRVEPGFPGGVGKARRTYVGGHLRKCDPAAQQAATATTTLAATLAVPLAAAIEVTPDNTIRVLDHGFVRLDGVMASDLSVANGARVSFARKKEELDEADEGLIRFLMRDRHGTPFEHNAFRFHIRCPIFVAREWMRHRVGSFNEFSMRYAKATDDFYVPDVEDVRTQVGKPGAYTFEPVDPELAERTREELRAVYDAAFETYERLVEAGVARELARCVVPVGAYTEFYWTINARSLMNFVSLRAAETAQREIRRYAEAVEQFFAEHMPVTHAAFIANDRAAP